MVCANFALRRALKHMETDSTLGASSIRCQSIFGRRKALAAFWEDVYTTNPEVEAFNWKQLLDWLIANGPAIMQLILTIIGLFGDDNA